MTVRKKKILELKAGKEREKEEKSLTHFEQNQEGHLRASSGYTISDSRKKLSKIKCAIFDAPFTDSYKMIKNIIVQAGFSNFFAKIILFFFRRSIKSSCKFDVIGDNKPCKKVSMIETPAIFMIGDKDELIDKEGFYEMF